MSHDTANLNFNCVLRAKAQNKKKNKSEKNKNNNQRNEDTTERDMKRAKNFSGKNSTKLFMQQNKSHTDIIYTQKQCENKKWTSRYTGV